MYNNDFYSSYKEISITKKQLEDIYKFNDRMQNKDGYFRTIREGGSYIRPEHVKSKDNIEGKLAEFALYNLFKEHNIECTEPSMWVGEKGKFDTGYDLTIKNKYGEKVNIEVKSSSLRARALMLEKKRWISNNDGRLINNDHPNLPLPDEFIMIIVDTEALRSGVIPKIFIIGVLPSKTLIECNETKESIFYRGDQIPTAQRKSPFDADNFVFPCFNAKINPFTLRFINNRYNSGEKYIHRMEEPLNGLNSLYNQHRA